jgi:uncharacterized protein YutE (UPF0331/DUF86 family)
MDKSVILQKLDSLARCVERIEAKCPPSAGALMADVDAQDILSLNLERAVQMAVDVALHAVSGAQPAPLTMGEAFGSLAGAQVIRTGTAERMRKAVGFRNIAVHQYQRLDWEIVWRLAKEHTGDFKEFAKEILAWLEKGKNP